MIDAVGPRPSALADICIYSYFIRNLFGRVHVGLDYRSASNRWNLHLAGGGNSCWLDGGAWHRPRLGPASPTAARAGADFCGAASLCHAHRAVPPAVALNKVTREHATLPPLVCACASLRRAARAVTQAYDAELRKTGVNPMQ